MRDIKSHVRPDEIWRDLFQKGAFDWHLLPTSVTSFHKLHALTPMTHVSVLQYRLLDDILLQHVSLLQYGLLNDVL